MRAALVIEQGQDLVVVDDVALDGPRHGEVRVAIRHCGLCHSDLHFIDGSLAAPTPLLLGHEAAGIVEAVGPGVTELAEGDSVVLTLRASCGRCYFCLRGQQELCAVGAAMVPGFFPDGETRLRWRGAPVHRAGVVLAAFAEATVVPASAAVKVPGDTPLEVAAVIGCAVQTGVGAALNTAKVAAGDTVVVVGLGGVGISVVQGARIAGAARIIGVDPFASRRQQAERFGCTDLVAPEDLLDTTREISDGIGVDHAFDCVGRAEVVETCLRAVRPGGTVVMIGVPPPDEVVSVRAIDHALQQKRLLGCFLGSSNAHRDFPKLLALWSAGHLDLDSMVTARVPLEEINQATADMRAGVGLRTVLSL